MINKRSLFLTMSFFLFYNLTFSWFKLPKNELSDRRPGPVRPVFHDRNASSATVRSADFYPREGAAEKTVAYKSVSGSGSSDSHNIRCDPHRQQPAVIRKKNAPEIKKRIQYIILFAYYFLSLHA